ncbi:DinB family protein [Streptomonospora nanhaiensis]|uniref:Mini-circle protein n=1 Tax=Streptomonospora nanhaiensis TaxID=1323731 RepID=A0A853BHY4_9ACTN|nr:DinB family protein [Streptomonospora nanhaiensis]MBV2366412.1 DinB family protein [Streptomonospora nanhaiensis]MBX9389955.1 DinB family protein [Streptomonospora nanhaiensis]NYI94231.1 hypothetical protein [Streptomonospora nanhaiensis]
MTTSDDVPSGAGPEGPAAAPSTAPRGERADLIAALATARAALTATVAGLDDAQAAARPTVSALSLGALVKHVAGIEEGWMRFAVEGPSALGFDLPEGVTWEDVTSGTAREVPQWVVDHRNGLRMLPGDTLAGLLARYERVAARSAEVIATVPDLSRTHPRAATPWGEPAAEISVRGVVLHVIAETAQHAGHADILREALDGRTAT